MGHPPKRSEKLERRRPASVWTVDEKSWTHTAVSADEYEASQGTEPTPSSTAAWVGATLGGFTIEASLVEAPGAWFFRGRDSSGRRALVQITPLKANRSGVTEFLRAVAAATTQLTQDPEVTVEHHGFERERGPGGALYWVLPWTGAAERLGQTKIRTSDELLAAARSLLERLIARHARGRLDPLLHADLIVARTGGADLLGIPVGVPEAWLDPAVVPPALAPEERAEGEPKRPGDLWRLGEALRALCRGVERPDVFDEWLERMSEPAPEQRLSDATQALEELQGVGDDIQAGRVSQASQSLKSAKQTLLETPPAPRDSSDLEESTIDGRTLADVPRSALEETKNDQDISTSDNQAFGEDMDGPPIDRPLKPRDRAADEAPTMWMDRGRLVEAAERRGVEPPPASSASEIRPMGPKGTVVGVRLPEEDADPRAPGGRSPATRVFDDPAGPAVPARDFTAPPNPSGNRVMGPGGTIAGTSRSGGRPPSVGAPLQGFEPPSASPMPLHDPASEERFAHPVPSLSPAQPQRLILTLIALVLLAVAAAAVVTILTPTKDVIQAAPEVATPGVSSEIKSAKVTPWNDVLLEALPASAQIVAVQDGRLLGPSPVRVLVPANVEVAVLITAPGYEPVQLVLPTRGRVTVHLTSTGGVLDCPVQIQAPGTQPLEVVGLDLQPKPSGYAIPGAVVMRSVEGHGAWLVRCATYGGQKRHHFVSRLSGPNGAVDLEVKTPVGASLTIEDKPASQIPGGQRISRGFVQVEASLSPDQKVARWIPAFQDTVIELPRPPPPKPKPAESKRPRRPRRGRR